MAFVTRKSTLFLFITAFYSVVATGADTTQCAGEVAAQNRAKASAYLNQNKANETVISSETGLQYTITKTGSGTETPRARDDIVAHYELFNLDGKKLESSYDKGIPLQFRLNEVIKGWQEAVAEMKAGEKRTLFVPASLAYGCKGSAPNIGPDEMLIFNMEIVAIVKPGQ